jgi:hypothetical protein
VIVSDESPGNPQILLRLPETIGIALQRDAKKTKRTMQAVLLEIAANHYGVEYEPPMRGKKKKPVE